MNPTLTVGIPAHNEQATIGDLIQNILEQRAEHFRLEKIIVVCDGCTDNTQSVVNEYAQRDARVMVINDGKRLGKAARLNQLYQMNKNDLIATFDADVLPASHSELATMVQVLTTNPRCSLVAAHVEPVKPSKGFIANTLYTNYVLWNMATNCINHGDHIHNIHGPASLLTREFARTITYPEHITCDEGYLYMTAKNANGFRYALDAKILMRPITSLSEMRYGVSRILHERNDLVPYFGESVLAQYHVPLRHKVTAVIALIFNHPIYTASAILYNIWIRFFSLSDDLNKQGMWRQANSTKQPIK